MLNTIDNRTTTKSALTVSTSLQLTLALGLGLGLFLLVGFAPIEAVHNATHDARHAFAFPCH